MSCDVCEGLGRYPIHNRYGKELYWIQCPECLGDGRTDQEADLFRREQSDRARYEAALADMRRGNDA